MLEEMTRLLKEKYGVTLLGSLGFENAYALAMRGDDARSMNVRSIADLARTRANCGSERTSNSSRGLSGPRCATVTASRFASERQYQSTFMYRAVASGEVDVISAFSSDGRIAAYDLVRAGGCEAGDPAV